MARTINISGRVWDRLSEAQRKRYRRYGITPSYYETGGSLQRARGHLPREHITRRERNPLGLTATDYRFLKNQQRRAAMKNFSPQISAYKRLSPRQRRNLRERVAKDHRAYKRAKSRSGVVRGKGSDGLKQEFKQIFVGAEDDYEEDDYEELDITQYENIYPDFDVDLKALMFYH